MVEPYHCADHGVREGGAEQGHQHGVPAPRAETQGHGEQVEDGEGREDGQDSQE